MRCILDMEWAGLNEMGVRMGVKIKDNTRYLPADLKAICFLQDGETQGVEEGCL